MTGTVRNVEQDLKDKISGQNQEIVRLNSVISNLEIEIKVYKAVVERFISVNSKGC